MCINDKEQWRRPVKMRSRAITRRGMLTIPALVAMSPCTAWTNEQESKIAVSVSLQEAKVMVGDHVDMTVVITNSSDETVTWSGRTIVDIFGIEVNKKTLQETGAARKAQLSMLGDRYVNAPGRLDRHGSALQAGRTSKAVINLAEWYKLAPGVSVVSIRMLFTFA